MKTAGVRVLALLAGAQLSIAALSPAHSNAEFSYGSALKDNESVLLSGTSDLHRTPNTSDIVRSIADPFCAEKANECFGVLNKASDNQIVIYFGLGVENATINSKPAPSRLSSPNILTCPKDTACTFTVNYTSINGQARTVTLVRTAANTIEPFTVADAKGTAPGPSGKSEPSGKFAALHRRLSILNVQNGLNSLGAAVFDRLDGAFGGGGNGPVITPTGFSASTRAVANWIGQKRRRKLEGQLADLPSYEDGPPGGGGGGDCRHAGRELVAGGPTEAEMECLDCGQIQLL